tara:strand:+ start:152 stop:445 length:294 start_codon:yes stop_codon:yes gene_type:complete
MLNPLEKSLSKAFHDRDRPKKITEALSSGNYWFSKAHFEICSRDSSNMKILAQDPVTRPLLVLLVAWAKAEGLAFEAMEEALHEEYSAKVQKALEEA